MSLHKTLEYLVCCASVWHGDLRRPYEEWTQHGDNILMDHFCIVAANYDDDSGRHLPKFKVRFVPIRLANTGGDSGWSSSFLCVKLIIIVGLRFTRRQYSIVHYEQCTQLDIEGGCVGVQRGALLNLVVFLNSNIVFFFENYFGKTLDLHSGNWSKITLNHESYYYSLSRLFFLIIATNWAIYHIS